MTERTSVPIGKSIFYRSTHHDNQSTERLESTTEPSTKISEMRSVSAEGNLVNITFYDKINESIQKALSNAVELLELARQTKIAADEAAEITLAQAHKEHAQLVQETNKLIEERDLLKLRIGVLQEDISIGETQLDSLMAKKETLQTEMVSLERRRDDLIETLQSRLAVIHQIQESLQEDFSIKTK